MNYQDAYKLFANDSFSSPNESGFWRRMAEKLTWSKTSEIIFDENSKKWFPNWQIDPSYNMLDRHLKNGLGDFKCLHFFSPILNQSIEITYSKMFDLVSRFANILKHTCHVGVDDRVLIQMGTTIETVIVLLACVRIGAIHSVIFSGFSSSYISDRIDYFEPKVIISSSAAVCSNTVKFLRGPIEEALSKTNLKVDFCIWVNREHELVHDKTLEQLPDFHPNGVTRYIEFHQEISKAQKCGSITVPTDHIFNVVYSSGTTGNPKGILRSTGDYMVLLATLPECLDTKSRETYFFFSDLGWILGNSGVFSTFLAGTCSMLFETGRIFSGFLRLYFLKKGSAIDKEGKCDFFLNAIEEEKPVVIGHAPSIFFQIKSSGSDVSIERLKRVYANTRILLFGGDKADEALIKWTSERLPDTCFFSQAWGQTELGGTGSLPCMGSFTQKIIARGRSYDIDPVSCAQIIPGCRITLQDLDDDADVMEAHSHGHKLKKIMIAPPFFPGFSTGYFKSDLNNWAENFTEQGVYDTHDVGYISEGLLYIVGRNDDIVKANLHRMNLKQLEYVIKGASGEINDAVVMVIPKALNAIELVCFLVLTSRGLEARETIFSEVKQAAKAVIDNLTRLEHCFTISKVPRTRTGKITRNTLKLMASNEPYKKSTAVEDSSIFDEIYEVLNNAGFQVLKPSI